MNEEDDDLSGLLEYNFKLSYQKLIEVIRKKTDIIKENSKNIEGLRVATHRLTEVNDNANRTIEEVQSQYEKMNVKLINYIS